MARWSLEVITPSASEPISLAEAKKQVELAASVTAHDELLTGLIKSARDCVEVETHRQLIEATLELRIDRFPSGQEPIYLPRVPLVSVTSIKYIDAAGVEQTLSADGYKAARRQPGEVHLTHGAIWPFARREVEAVCVRYVAGAATAADVPPRAREAMLLLIAHWFENREAAVAGSMAELPLGVQRLFSLLKVGDAYTNYGGR